MYKVVERQEPLLLRVAAIDNALPMACFPYLRPSMLQMLGCIWSGAYVSMCTLSLVSSIYMVFSAWASPLLL
jgi:hypothetical protein